MCHYSRCICFGCGAGSGNQLNGFAEDDDGDQSSNPVQRSDSGNFHKNKDKKAFHMQATDCGGSDEIRDKITQDETSIKRNSILASSAAFSAPAAPPASAAAASANPVTDCKLDYSCWISVKRRRTRTRRRLSNISLVTGNHCRCSRHVCSLSKNNSSLLDIQYMTQAKTLLTYVNKWTFNIFTLESLTNGRSLYHLTLHLFHQYRFIEKFQLDIVKLMRCIALIESGYYSSNPYHNAVHAADVVQAMHFNLQEPKLSSNLLLVEKMAAILAAASHDLDHPGVNQAFLIATSNPLAALYHNTSVLENHHYRATLSILGASKVFEHLDRTSWQTVNSLIQSVILATDITRQQQILAQFKGHLDAGSLDLAANESHRNFILQIALKCADICNPCRPWLICKKWSEMICEEFFRQGDCESKLGLQVSFDQSKSTVAGIQKGFIDFIVRPLFLEWNRFLQTGSSRMLQDNLETNRSRWQELDNLLNKEKRPEERVIGPTVTQHSHDVGSLAENVEHLREPCCNDDKEARLDPEESSHNLPLGFYSFLPENFFQSGNVFRRHSLPTDTLQMETDGWQSVNRRRSSLPVNELSSGIHCKTPASKLASLPECSPTCARARLSLSKAFADHDFVELDVYSRNELAQANKITTQSHRSHRKPLLRRASFPFNEAIKRDGTDRHDGTPKFAHSPNALVFPTVLYLLTSQKRSSSLMTSSEVWPANKNTGCWSQDPAFTSLFNHQTNLKLNFDGILKLTESDHLVTNHFATPANTVS